MRLLICYVAVLSIASVSAFGESFTNWENPHVHPLDNTPDGNRLLAVNLPDAQLEVFDISNGTPMRQFSVPVGIDPVSVRARSNTEAWVVNHISDSVSIVDLTTGHVVHTLDTDDEPADVIFSETSARAFVSCSQTNTVLVWDLNALDAPPQRLNIIGEDPRALAFSEARDEVYLAVFESGNNTTILGGGSQMGGGFPPNVVNNNSGPHNGTNPPPNDGNNFTPAQNPANPNPPAVGMIVKKNDAGQWMDDNNGNWTDLVSGANANASGRPQGWDLYDHDLAIIDAGTLDISYATGLMNICMSLAVHPTTQEVTVIGTDATNEVRFEPVLRGRFLRVNMARVSPAGASTLGVQDLNQHLTYGATVPFVPIPQEERDKSLGDPRAIVWMADGTRGYVAGMGSNNVVMIDSSGTRLNKTLDPLQTTIEVGEGPTGLALNERDGVLYVLNKFSSTLSVVDLATETEVDQIAIHDATPTAVKVGRKHLYDTHRNSGLGHIACASCHVDARMDRLAWDLGAPDGEMKAFDQNCLIANNCEDWHPMKGPMTTQTMQHIIGMEPLHWRGDRFGIEEFAEAFLVLQGADEALPTEGPVDEMQDFEDFLASIYFPPNPYRKFDNSLPTDLPLPGHFTTGRFGPAGQPLPNGNAQAGLFEYRTGGLDGGLQCVTCHTMPTGAGADGALVGFPPTFQPLPPGPEGERHLTIVSIDGSTNVSMKTPHLRNQYDKVGFETTQQMNTAGFGFLHDGSVDSIARFVNEPVFSLASDQETADMVAFMLAFAGSDLPDGSPTNPLEPPGPPSQDTHAAVGTQTTLVDIATASAAQIALMNDMMLEADLGRVGLIVKARVGGVLRGARYDGAGIFQTDRAGETITTVDLQALAAPGSEQTWTVVVAGAETRLGVDRDEDGFFDRDEIDNCSDPADPLSVPGAKGDLNSDNVVDIDDIDGFSSALLSDNPTAFEQDRADTNCDGTLNGADIASFMGLLLQ